jgi:hypothetical protein
LRVEIIAKSLKNWRERRECSFLVISKACTGNRLYMCALSTKDNPALWQR